MSGSIQEEEELPANHTGPKGVINDWRRFKLDSVDQTVPQSKRELLRQMSSPREDDKERLNRKMSVQEYELIQVEDERCLKRYRKQCMQEMHERLSFGPTFEAVYDLESGEAFIDIIEKEQRLTLVVVHIYQHGVKGCEQLNSCLDCLASEYSSVKFCRIDAVATGAAERFSSENHLAAPVASHGRAVEVLVKADLLGQSSFEGVHVKIKRSPHVVPIALLQKFRVAHKSGAFALDVLPALLVYKAGELLGNFLAVTKHFNEDFFAVDVEAFLNGYGLLPEKEFTACADDEDEGGDVE